MATSVTELLGIRYPIVQGPFGSGLSSVRLAATVSNLGGLGSFGAQIFSPSEITDIVNALKQETSYPFAINLWVSDRDENAKTFSAAEYKNVVSAFQPYFEQVGLPLPPQPQLPAFTFAQQMEAIIRSKPAVFSFVFGIPEKAILDECSKQGIKTLGAATTVEEALALQDAGVDAVVASGFEAGGHRISFLKKAEDSLHGTFSLIPLMTKRVKIPVIAAGGIVNAQTAAAAMLLGAQAVQVGTAFLACEESGASALHKAALFSDLVNHSALTKVFTGRLARGTRSVLSEQLKDNQYLAPYPLQGKFISSLQAELNKRKQMEYLTFWSSQSAPLLRYHTAKEVFEDIRKGIES